MQQVVLNTSMLKLNVDCHIVEVSGDVMFIEIGSDLFQIFNIKPLRSAGEVVRSGDAVGIAKYYYILTNISHQYIANIKTDKDYRQERKFKRMYNKKIMFVVKRKKK